MTTILAIESSTESASAALRLADGSILGCEWEQTLAGRQQMVLTIQAFLHKAGLSPAGIDRYVVGLGPGSFSGIRAAVAFASGCALPQGRPVEGIPSPDVIASAWLDGHRSLAVIGDARRNRLWTAIYREGGDGAPVVSRPLGLVNREDLPDVLAGVDLIVSPDAERLAVAIPACPAGVAWPPRVAHPAASTLLDLALRRLDQGRPLEAPTPVYMHPPVFVPPRFPAEQETGTASGAH